MSNRHPLIKQLKRELYKKSFYEFVKAFWSYADPSKFVDSELIEYYCEVFQYMSRPWWDYKEVPIDLSHLKDENIINVRQNRSNLNLVVPPRHSKSMIFNVMGPVWLWIIHPVKAVSVSHTGQLASQMNSKRHMIINSSLFKEIFDEIQLVSNTTSSIKDVRGGELYSINRNAFTGYGGDVIINDDLTNAETARKDQQEMNNAWSYYRNTMPSRINDVKKCIIMNIQQRLAPNDITGHILNHKTLREQYVFITLPAVMKEKTHLIFPLSGKIKTFEKGEGLWPERFGNYDSLRHQVGESVFETQYLQNPVATDKTIIKEHQIIEKQINEVPQYDEAEIVFASHDFPIKEKETSDYMGSVLAYRVNQTLYIKDCLEKKMAFVKSVEYVQFLNDRFPGIIQIIEDKANGSPILQQLQDVVPGLQAYNPKSNSKTQRLESASLYMESQNVVFVKDVWNEESQKYVLSEKLQNLKTRLLNFPFVQHDDVIDAFSMCVLYVFMERRNNVYARSFNGDNVITTFPEKISSKVWFINREGSYVRLNQIGIDYINNKLYVLEERELKGDVDEVLLEFLKESGVRSLVDVSEIPLSFRMNKVVIEQINIDDFHQSATNLDVHFSRNNVLIGRDNKRTIGDIENFKWSTNKDDEVKYVTEKDGFIKNIRGAIRFLGLLN